MKKLLGILVLGLILCSNAYAGKAKPGSGPVNFTEKEIKDFHIYITKKLNSKAMKEYGVEGFSFNYGGKPFYANHFLITGSYKRIFQWDIKERNLGPEKGLCSGPACKIFAKKNKIVWKGAKTKIPRDITLSQLKLVLKDLGFYDGDLSTEKKESKKINTTEKKETKKISKEYNLEGARPIAFSWDGYAELIAGTVKFDEANYKGVLNLELPNNDGNCEGSYSLQNDGKGTWQISCTNNMGAAGTLKWIKDGSVTGIGRDHNDKKVKFTVSKQS